MNEPVIFFRSLYPVSSESDEEKKMRKVWVVTLISFLALASQQCTVENRKEDLSAAILSQMSVDPYTAICKEDSSVGFSWEKNGWVQENFTTETYIVQKLNPSAQHGEAHSEKCSTNLKIVEDTTGLVDACYSISNLGEKSSIANYVVCREEWHLGKENPEIRQVACPASILATQVLFAPNGNFILTKIDVTPASNIEGKDSLVLSVGNCSVMER